MAETSRINRPTGRVEGHVILVRKVHPRLLRIGRLSSRGADPRNLARAEAFQDIDIACWINVSAGRKREAARKRAYASRWQIDDLEVVIGYFEHIKFGIIRREDHMGWHEERCR